tara:strand:- start:1885 stop:2070 length:186 start_codon:yes stop_codon:yes gene_type:complete
MEDDKRDLLWVFDTVGYLEIYAPDRASAHKKLSAVESESGLDFVLAQDWETYQQERSQICK